jgi:hypothetical protein
VPYSHILKDDSDHSVTGVFVLYHLKQFRGADDIVPLYLGYGNIVSELRKIEDRLQFLSPAPLFFDYIANPKEPHLILEALKQRYKPVIR